MGRKERLSSGSVCNCAAFCFVTVQARVFQEVEVWNKVSRQQFYAKVQKLLKGVLSSFTDYGFVLASFVVPFYDVLIEMESSSLLWL